MLGTGSDSRRTAAGLDDDDGDGWWSSERTQRADGSKADGRLLKRAPIRIATQQAPSTKQQARTRRRDQGPEPSPETRISLSNNTRPDSRRQPSAKHPDPALWWRRSDNGIAQGSVRAVRCACHSRAAVGARCICPYGTPSVQRPCVPPTASVRAALTTYGPRCPGHSLFHRRAPASAWRAARERPQAQMTERAQGTPGSCRL